MAAGRLIGDLLEGIGPLFRGIFDGIGALFSGLGEVVLGLLPDVVFQLLVNEIGIGPALIGVLAVTLLVALIGMVTRRSKQPADPPHSEKAEH